MVDTNGNAGSRSYTANIGGASALTVNPATLPAGTQGAVYSQTVSASGGNGSYTYAVSAGALPTGLSLNVSSGVISGTPTAGGSYSVTIRATDTVGNTGNRAYSFNVGTSSLTVNPSTLPAGRQGVAYSQTVSASGGTGPYTYLVSAGALPTGLSLNPATGVISGTPTTGGSSSFSISATDALGNVGTRANALNIGTNSLTINPATLPAAVAGKSYSATVVASGGSGPYTYSVSSGALPPGLTLNAVSGAIGGAVATRGSYPFTIQARDLNGNTGSRAYSLVNRPDPALDPEVTGLVNAQAATARRFTSAQIDNVSRHLESLHDHFNPCSVDFGLRLPQSTDQPSSPYSPYSPSPAAAARSYELPANSPAREAARRGPGSQECADDGFASEIAAWISGAVQFGSVTPDGVTTGNKFTTSGLTAGVDWRAADNLVAGFAVGYGTDHTNIGLRGTLSAADSITGTAYASYKPFDPWFIDAMMGFGALGYNNRRFVADDSVTVAGTRKGTTWFGAVSTGYEMRYDALRISPYVRVDFMSAQLDGYSEQGGSAELLTYGSTAFHSVAGTLGLRGCYDIPVDWGVLTPTARAEYRYALDGGLRQSMYYTDAGSSFNSTLVQGSTTRGTVNTGIGFRARAAGGMTAELDYAIASASAKQQTQSVRASLKLPFW